MLTTPCLICIVFRTGRKTRLNVCLDGIKCGTGYKDTWITSLQQIHMITPQVARSIAEEYPTIRSLYEGYKKCASVYDAWSMLEGIRVSFLESLFFFLFSWRRNGRRRTHTFPFMMLLLDARLKAGRLGLERRSLGGCMMSLWVRILMQLSLREDPQVE